MAGDGGGRARAEKTDPCDRPRFQHFATSQTPTTGAQYSACRERISSPSLSCISSHTPKKKNLEPQGEKVERGGGGRTICLNPKLATKATAAHPSLSCRIRTNDQSANPSMRELNWKCAVSTIVNVGCEIRR